MDKMIKNRRRISKLYNKVCIQELEEQHMWWGRCILHINLENMCNPKSKTFYKEVKFE